MSDSQIELGARARDRVTGFTGVVTARADYLYDTPQLRLTAEDGQDALNERWITESRCEPTDVPQTGFGR